MRIRRTHRIGPAEAEQLVAGDHPGPAHTPLKNLLDAARAPATDQELSGEKAVVAAFTAHRRRAARAARRAPARTRTAVVTITAGLALLTLSGTAVAARTGNLPQEAQQHAHRLFSALGVPAPRTGTTRAPVPSASTAPAPGATATPRVLVLGWCDSWRGATPLSRENRRKLVAAAGNEKRVDRYCADLRRSASAAPSGSPGTGRQGPATTPRPVTPPEPGVPPGLVTPLRPATPPGSGVPTPPPTSAGPAATTGAPRAATEPAGGPGRGQGLGKPGAAAHNDVPMRAARPARVAAASAGPPVRSKSAQSEPRRASASERGSRAVTGAMQSPPG
ncbi:MAG TPA: hypothetical protein VFW27_15730 [Actinoplanes sp.]|nr:hypothetical protein [Actinoplanes sp.]